MSVYNIIWFFGELWKHQCFYVKVNKIFCHSSRLLSLKQYWHLYFSIKTPVLLWYLLEAHHQGPCNSSPQHMFSWRNKKIFTWLPLLSRAIWNVHQEPNKPVNLMLINTLSCKALTLCMLGNFACFFCHLWIFLKTNFFKKIFQEYHQSVKQFGSRSGPTFYWAWSGSKLFAKFISRRQKLPLEVELTPD